MDFIMIPLVVGIVTYGIYSFFELFVRRKERIMFMEKIGEKFDASLLQVNKLKLPSFSNRLPFSFNSLKWGSLLLGVGFGLLFGFLVNMLFLNYMKSHCGLGTWDLRNNTEIVYGSCVLLFGGLGLILSFVLEKSIARKEMKQQKEREKEME